MPRVQNLFRAPKKHLPMEELSVGRAVGNTGFEDCAHARPGSKRQVLVVERETLEAMDLRPGIIGENITTDGMNVNSLQTCSFRSAEHLCKSVRYAPPVTRWKQFVADFRKSFGDGMACCVAFWRAE